MPYARTWVAAALLLVAPALAHGQTADTSAAQILAQNPPAPAPPAVPSVPPAPAQPPRDSPTQAAPAQPGADPFGEEVTLTGKTIIYMSGNPTSASRFETLIDAFKPLTTYLDRPALSAS